jgi:hypothetical protein
MQSVAQYLCALLFFLPSVSRIELACPQMTREGERDGPKEVDRKNCEPLSIIPFMLLDKYVAVKRQSHVNIHIIKE